MYRFINNNLNSESIIDVVFQKGIIPNVTHIENHDIGKLIKPPELCPECNSTLILKHNKNTVTLTCINPSCPGILIKKLEHFCKNMKIKNISVKTLKSFMDISENDISKVFKLIESKVANEGYIKDLIEKSTISDLLIALDLFTKTQITKNSKLNSIQSYLVRDYIILIRDDILSSINSPIVDVIKSYLI